jgi:hypothetical protein
VNGVATIEGAIFFNLQATGNTPFVLGGGIVLVLALRTLKLDDISGHKSPSIFIDNNKVQKAPKRKTKGTTSNYYLAGFWKRAARHG